MTHGPPRFSLSRSSALPSSVPRTRRAHAFAARRVSRQLTSSSARPPSKERETCLKGAMSTSGNSFASTSKTPLAPMSVVAVDQSVEQQQQQSTAHHHHQATGAAAFPPPPPPPAPTPTTTTKSRIRRACVACFTAKVRCSGEAPHCARCLRKSVECYYDPAGNSRKGQQGQQFNQPRKRRGSSSTERVQQQQRANDDPATAAAAAAAAGRPASFSGPSIAATGRGGGGGGIGPLLAPESSEGEGSPTNAAPPIVVRQPFFRWLGEECFPF